MPDEVLFDAVSDLDEATGQPYYGQCTLIIGDGTSKIEFNGGRAKVPESLSRVLARNPRIKVYSAQAAPTAIQPALTADTASVEFADSERPPASPEALELAKEYLQQEGEDVPDEGDASAPRCEALKADGSQCQNPAQPGSKACRLAAHKEKVAAAA